MGQRPQVRRVVSLLTTYAQTSDCWDSCVQRYKKHLEETPALFPYLNLPVPAIYVLPLAAVVVGIVRAL